MKSTTQSQIDDWRNRLGCIRKDLDLLEIDPDPLYFRSVRKRISSLMAEMQTIVPVRTPDIIVQLGQTTSSIDEEVVNKSR